MSKLNDKIALVTGASKGIGAAIARRLAERGATVAVNYTSDREGAERVVSDIEASGGAAVGIQADIRDAASVRKMLGEVAKLGELDILVNNAGQYNMGPAATFDEESYHRIFGTNVLGLLLVTREAIPTFRSSGGSIVNISSSIVKSSNAMSPVYGASKAAVNYLTTTLAIELTPKKIRVNAVLPGMIETEAARSSGIISQEMVDFISARTVAGRVGQPEDVALAVAYLASDDARWITGELIGANGGCY